jgi:hypothetical protein
MLIGALIALAVAAVNWVTVAAATYTIDTFIKDE